jgi:hypothetical protein
MNLRKHSIATAVAILATSVLALATATAPVEAAGRTSPVSGNPTSPVYSNANWNGYVQADRNDTRVSAAWNVPADNCNGAPLPPLPPASDNIWVGLGGITIGGTITPLVQIGTSSECDYGLTGVKQNDSPVYELVYPNGSGTGPVKGSQPVQAGDTMWAYVDEGSQGNYNLYLEDQTQGWNWSVPVITTNSQTAVSADWIVESGVIQLAGKNLGNRAMANFGNVTFASMFFETTTGGTQGVIDSRIVRLQAGSPQTHVAPPSGHSGVITWNAQQ